MQEFSQQAIFIHLLKWSAQVIRNANQLEGNNVAISYISLLY